jgi:hypothetical protein
MAYHPSTLSCIRFPAFSYHKNNKAISRGRVITHELHGLFIKARVEMCRGTGYLETLAEMRTANDKVSVRGISSLASISPVLLLFMTSFEALPDLY